MMVMINPFVPHPPPPANKEKKYLHSIHTVEPSRPSRFSLNVLRPHQHRHHPAISATDFSNVSKSTSAS